MKLLFGRGHLLRAARLEACASCCERASHLPVHLREVEVRLGEGAVHVKDHAAKHWPGCSGHAARARHSGEMRRATKDERGKGAEHAKLARPRGCYGRTLVVALCGSFDWGVDVSMSTCTSGWVP